MEDTRKKVDYYEYNTSDKNKYDISFPEKVIDKLTLDKELFMQLLIDIATDTIKGTSKDLSDVTVPDIINYLYSEKNINDLRFS